MYQHIGAQMIALRAEGSGTTQASTLYYLHSDHLGSTSLVTNASGGVVSRQSYYAYGGIRAQTTKPPTDIGFTAQRNDNMGLMDFRSREYSVVSGRFLSADTIVPGAGNPQALNRYMFVLGNPVKYTDPSGHGVDCGIGTNCVRQPNKPHEQQDKRDFTKWMPRGLVRMATDPRIEAIAAFPDVLWGKHLAFASLVGDKKPFDIKVSHEKIVGDKGLKLGDNWYEFSTPGNIACRFYGAATGYSLDTLHAGAGVAQTADAVFGNKEWGEPQYLMDTKDDYYAVEFGYQLYTDYYLPDGKLTQNEFVNALDVYPHRNDMDIVPAPSNYFPMERIPYAPDEFFNP